MRILTGKVVSKKMNKTATVEVARTASHPMYKKRINKVKRYQVHDEVGVNIGDNVQFADSKPYSRTKKWVIVTNKKGEKKK